MLDETDINYRQSKDIVNVGHKTHSEKNTTRNITRK
jgi:hypothetical protein